MTLRNLTLAAVAALVCAASASPARAAQVLYSGVGFLQGSQSFSESFSVSSPGTLTVTLGNVNWPTQLASLNLLVSSPNGALGPEMGAGTSSFNVKAGEVFTQWFGTAQGALNAGVYSLEIQFQPNATGNAVPLPTSVALLLSGLCLLIWQRRTRSPASESYQGSGQNIEAA